MKKSFMWIVLGILGVLLVGVIVYFSFFVSNARTKTTQDSGFPSSGTQSESNQQQNSMSQSDSNNSSIMKVPSSNGSAIATKNFVRNGTTIQDPANPNSYYVAGSSGACKGTNNCPHAGTNTDYNIVYSKTDGSFIIGLATEPLGTVRLEAEKTLQTELGITQPQMCELKILVITTTYVNQQFGGKNLGLSFCPGSMQLPN